MAPATAAQGTNRRAAHVEDTRRGLLDAARALFTERGYQATATEEIVHRAGLTRGALYHHFRDKADLFESVFDEVAGEVSGSLRRLDATGGTGAPGDAWDLYRLNNEIYLDAASGNSAYRQVVLIDGPAVFGWTLWSHRTRDDGGVRHIARYIERAIDAGTLAEQPVLPLAQVLSALGHRAVMYIACADDRGRARAEMGECVNRILDGLQVAR